MTNRAFHNMMHESRYTLSAQEKQKIDETLNSLLRLRRRTAGQRAAMATSVAAALILFVTLAMPPIVEAVGAWMDRIFDARLQEVEQELSMPEDEKLQAQIDELNRFGLGYELEGAQAELGGVTVSIQSLYFNPDDAYDESTEGHASVTLTYSDIPAFDPNYVDFVLTLGGETHALSANDQSSIADYRSLGERRTTREAWQGDNWEWSSLSQLRIDALETHLSFDVDPWKLEEPTEGALTGVIDGERFSIPFTFEPDRARAQNAKWAQENIDSAELYARRKKEELTRITEEAIPLGIVSRVGDVDFSLAEISVTGGDIYLSASFGPVPMTHPTEAAHTYTINGFIIDGRHVAGKGTDADKIVDGVYSTIYSGTIQCRPEELPEESLIMVSAEKYGLVDEAIDTWDLSNVIQETTDVPFRVHWATGAVTRPADEEERRAWVLESQQMEQAYLRDFPVAQQYDLLSRGLTDRQNGIALTIERATFEYSSLVFDYAFEYDAPKGTRYQLEEAEAVVSINGMENRFTSDWGNPQRGELYVSTTTHFSEFGKDTRVEMTLPFVLYDGEREINRGTFNFTFTLDRESMNPRVMDVEEWSEKQGFE